MNLTEDQKIRMREFLAQKGRAVEFTGRKDDYQPVSTYGWTDYDAMEHTSAPRAKYGHSYGGGCSWIVESGVVLREVSYSMFMDTFSGNEEEVGVECAPVRCSCGRYNGVTLRWVGTLGDLMLAIFGPATPTPGVIL